MRNIKTDLRLQQFKTSEQNNRYDCNMNNYNSVLTSKQLLFFNPKANFIYINLLPALPVSDSVTQTCYTSHPIQFDLIAKT